MNELLVVQQRGTVSGCVPWILDEKGNRTPGFDDDRRMTEVQDGLQRHPRARRCEASTSSAEVEQTLAALHDRDYLQALGDAPAEEAVLISELAEPGLAPDTPICAAAVTAAREGVRTSIAAAAQILEGARFTYALCRPPGHHAGPGWLGGYCYLNNAAAAAHTLLSGADQSKSPPPDDTPPPENRQASGSPALPTPGLPQERHGVKRPIAVAILDVDLHYPNGTAAIVARMPSMCLHSLHGSTGANLPWQRVHPRSDREQLVSFRSPPSEDEYAQALLGMIAAIRGRCSAIVLSLGYDTIAADPHGAWGFAPAMFARVGGMLASSDLSVCVVQEGGYALGALADCSEAFARGLLNGGEA